MAAEVRVDFDAAAQSLSALNAAAYRLIGTATCQIDKEGARSDVGAINAGSNEIGGRPIGHAALG